MNRDKVSNLYRESSLDANYQVSVHLAKPFQRRRLKCEKLADDRRLMLSDGKSSLCLWQGELKILIQHYVIKVVSDLRQVGGFLWVLQFPSPIKLTDTEILLKVVLNTINQTIKKIVEIEAIKIDTPNTHIQKNKLFT